MDTHKEPPLDEIQWRHPLWAQSFGGIHSNSVLFYFAQSPFFDQTSNNAVLANQAMYNPAMHALIGTRDAFEGRLREMSGLEFIVAQEPAETGPGMGTGVWVIRKQTRRKRDPDDDITIHSTYYIVGENIVMAPTLAQVLSFRMSTLSASLAKCFPAADESRTWKPAQGHVYRTATNTTRSRPRALAESKESTPMPGQQAVTNKGDGTTEARKADTDQEGSDAQLTRLAEQSMMIHLQYGGDYMDENPITGKPGEFHFSSTGRKDKFQAAGITALNTMLKSPAAPDLGGRKAKDGKSGDKTPKTPTGGPARLRRKKSKTGQTPTSS
ncbi:MED6 mediator sub complex component-domain-containing protein [Xylariaceae sp. FL0255]|nr:MED6 mediator sub complex component-domain-containing protein [Xylariaceae sp. FL0255]